MPESGVKSREISILKEFKRYDKSFVCVPRQDSGVKVLEGNYCDKLRQIGAIGLSGYYGFTTIEKFKIKGVYIMIQ